MKWTKVHDTENIASMETCVPLKVLA